MDGSNHLTPRIHLEDTAAVLGIPWHLNLMMQNYTRWWQLKYFLFSPRKLGKMNPFWRSYFSNGLKPPTSIAIWLHMFKHQTIMCVEFLLAMQQRYYIDDVCSMHICSWNMISFLFTWKNTPKRKCWSTRLSTGQDIQIIGLIFTGSRVDLSASQTPRPSSYLKKHPLGLNGMYM